MICIAENSGGTGGVAGGGGSSGQPSQSADGAGSAGYGYPVIETTTGIHSSFDIQLTKDTDGELPADLSGATAVKFIARPSMRYGRSSRDIEVDCQFTPDGKVTLELGPEQVDNNNGVWYCEFIAYDGDRAVASYRAYLCIRKGMTGSDSCAHTITPMDVRLALMDTSAEANQLLDDLEFSDMLILHAVERCVDEWNETPPSLSRVYTAVDFPYREHLVKGAAGYLLESIAYRYTRNRMQYSASGLSLDTSDKGPQYVQLAMQARQAWKNFIAAKKTEQNMAECMGTFELPYFGSRRYW